MARLPYEVLGSALANQPDPARWERNQSSMQVLDEQLLQRRQELRGAWGHRASEAPAQHGRLPTPERIDLLKDPGTPFLPIGTFVNWGTRLPGIDREVPGAGVITGFIRVHGRWVALVANDNRVASGAWWPRSPEKIQRIQEIALQLHLPVVYLVESSGLYLPLQAQTFAGAHGAGAIFRLNAILAAHGVPQVAGVFGPCIAGGGYMPIISDRVVMTEQAYMVIAGSALSQCAKSTRLSDLDIGGPEVHVHQSGCADVRVPDDEACVRVIRDEIKRMPTSAVAWYQGDAAPMAPQWSPSEIGGFFPADYRDSYDIRQVLARLLDASLFHEVLPQAGPEIILGVGRIQGLPVGVVANNSQPVPHPRQPGTWQAGHTLHRDGVAKMSAFARHCHEDGLPMLWFQDVAGFDIGQEAEAEGLLGYGSSLIYTHSTPSAPVITVLLRRASGAGYYAQAGMPFHPTLQLATPITRLAVMEPHTLAVATCSRHLDDTFRVAATDPRENARIEERMARIEESILADMSPYAAASRMDVDEIVALRELRSWLEAIVEMCYQATGQRRIRNPRIWSLHDLEALCSSR